MPFLRSEPKRFAQRCIPIKFARALRSRRVAHCHNRPAAGVAKAAVLKNDSGEPPQIPRLGLPIWSARSEKLAPVPIIRCQAAQIGRNRSSGLPGHNILQPPIAQKCAAPPLFPYRWCSPKGSSYSEARRTWCRTSNDDKPRSAAKFPSCCTTIGAVPPMVLALSSDFAKV